MTHKKFYILAFLIVLLSSYPLHVSAAYANTPHGIILISLDTLRADHLGIYGYHRDTSPSIDAFANESVVFDNAVVQSPWTLPSHMSIMTSLYPSFHGLDNKGSQRLADEHTTLAEFLQEGGYQTAAFTGGSWVSGRFGFNRGFDSFDDQGWYGIASILPKVKKWLDENKQNPFFLFIHCYDIHHPYNPPPPYNSMFHDFIYRGNLIPSAKALMNSSKKKLSNEDVRHLIALYDGGIRYTDEEIGKFLSYLREARLYEQTLIIITSDHGEAFKEHGELLHGQLYYRPNLHVPLIVRIPNYPKKEIRVSELVQSIDLLPTILDIARRPAHPKAQGESLLPLIKRQKNQFNRFLGSILSPFERGSSVAFAEHRSNKQTYRWSIITDDGYQMISSPDSSYSQLFNISTDPLAQNSIAQSHSTILERLGARYKEVYSVAPRYRTSSVDLDEDLSKQLKALGYIDFDQDSSVSADDLDGDGIINAKDNCPRYANPSQKDSDGDEVGNMCDNCPEVYNPNQENIDDEWFGDACDECIDTDWDRYGNPGFPNNTCPQDNCPAIFNPLQEDSDADGKGDFCDNCADYYNPTQDDLDKDGIGDVCDNCINRANGTKRGTCLGGMKDGLHCLDDELCGSNAICSMDQEDSDGDGRGDVCNHPEDFDNDTIDDSDDNCPFTENPLQEDSYPPQGNGIGDACECEGDFNCDGSVNAVDSSLFFKYFNQRTKLDNPCTNKNQCNGDFDCDGDVDENDRTIFQTDFGRGKYNNPCPICDGSAWCSY